MSALQEKIKQIAENESEPFIEGCHTGFYNIADIKMLLTETLTTALKDPELLKLAIEEHPEIMDGLSDFFIAVREGYKERLFNKTT